MLLRNLLVVAGLGGLRVVAQSSSSTSSSASSSSGSSSSGSTIATATGSAPISTHTVQVGADGLNYSPHETNALIGDVIEFRFYPQNHSVARAAFGPFPCIPYEYTDVGKAGFWSGFQPVAVVEDSPPIFRVTVNDSEPIFYYCSAPGACLDNGMIGVINPNDTWTFAQQFNYTRNATVQFGPGENFPKETAAGTRTDTIPTATSTASFSSTSTPAATTSPAAAASGSSHSGLPVGAIIGIALGSFAVILLFAALLYMCGRQKSIKELLLRQSTISTAPTAYQPASPGFSEANYPNMIKSPVFVGEHGGGFDVDSYRSMSPPLEANERTGMIGGGPGSMHPSQFSGLVSPATVNGTMMGSFGAFREHMGPQEMEQTDTLTGLRPYNPTPTTPDSGPHEMPVPSRNTSTTTHPPHPSETRPFSYTSSESGYLPGQTLRDEKDPRGLP